MFGSIPFLRLYYDDIDEEAFRDKYGSLYLGLNTKEKNSLTQPSIYMLRRFLFAMIIVFWQNRNAYQIMTMVFI